MGWLRDLWEKLRGGKPAPVEQEGAPPTPAVEPESMSPTPEPPTPEEEAQELRDEVRAKDEEKFASGESPPRKYEES